MKEAATHFEQVPRAVIEKILAQQATPAEKERGENDAAAKLAADQVEDPTFLSPKG